MTENLHKLLLIFIGSLFLSEAIVAYEADPVRGGSAINESAIEPAERRSFTGYNQLDVSRLPSRQVLKKILSRQKKQTRKISNVLVSSQKNITTQDLLEKQALTHLDTSKTPEGATFPIKHKQLKNDDLLIRTDVKTDTAPDVFQVSKGDSLRKIALKILPQYSGLENLKTLTAKIIKLNPNNFINNDADLLRADLDLRLPEKSLKAAKNIRQKIVSTDILKKSVTNSYKVRKNDSLSMIAWKLKPLYPGYSSYRELMRDLANSNPQAFIKGNINRLRTGVSLLIPAKEVQKYSKLSYLNKNKDSSQPF